MSASYNRQIVRELIQILTKASRSVAIRAEPLEAADVHITDNHLSRNESKVAVWINWVRRFTRERVVAREAKRVDYAARKYSCFSDCKKSLVVGSDIGKV